MKVDLIKSVRDFFESHNNFVVTAHIRPDGDAIGSVIGLSLSLQSLGKKVQMVLPDGIPGTFSFLEGSAEITEKISGDYDAIIALDSADMGRLGNSFKELKPGLNIDHHVTNDSYAELNWVEADASATAEILADHLPAWGLPITKAVAEALLTGILIDTIGFKTSNVTPKTLRLTADLIQIGANLSVVYNKGLEARSFEAVRLWGSGITNLQMSDGIIWTRLTLKDRETANYPGGDDADLINILSSITRANLAVVFVEQKNGTVKVSWRAKPGYDVSKVAVSFGGGGHKAASGAQISGPLEKVQRDVLAATQLLIE
jgi:phosphoesterase RecJ-like protein